MFKKVFFVCFFLLSSLGFANELDNENSVTNVRQEFTGTVVFRINSQNGQVDMLQVSETLEAGQPVSEMEFSKVSTDKVVTELDKDSGTSSWYYYWPRGWSYSYGYYCYYGYYYTPYYAYTYGYYSYYYYNYYRSYWWW